MFIRAFCFRVGWFTVCLAIRFVCKFASGVQFGGVVAVSHHSIYIVERPNSSFTKSCDVSFMTPLTLFMQTRRSVKVGGGGGGCWENNVLAPCANFDRTNGFYEDHSGKDQ